MRPFRLQIHSVHEAVSSDFINIHSIYKAVSREFIYIYIFIAFMRLFYPTYKYSQHLWGSFIRLYKYSFKCYVINLSVLRLQSPKCVGLDEVHRFVLKCMLHVSLVRVVFNPHGKNRTLPYLQESHQNSCDWMLSYLDLKINCIFLFYVSVFSNPRTDY